MRITWFYSTENRYIECKVTIENDLINKIHPYVVKPDRKSVV